MLNSKVIDLLKSFSGEELKKFSEFLNSPFLNKNKKALQLFNLLSKYHPEYESKNLTKEKLFKKIFSEGKSEIKYNDTSIRNLFSDLMISAEKFLSYINFENDKFYFNERILRELSNRRLSGVFEKKLKKTNELFIRKEFQGEDDFYKKYISEELKSLNSQFYDNLKHYKNDYLINASDYLTFFYLIKVFKMINFFEWQKQYNINHPVNIARKIIYGINMDEILVIVKQKSEEDFLVLSVYYKMFLALTNPENEEYYFEFKKNLITNDKLFSLLEKYGLYACLTNSCVQKIDSGNDNYFKECFDVYKLMFEKKVFDAYPGFFPMTTFTAILQTGLSSEDFVTVEKFIYDYSSKLNPEHKEDAVNYSLAQLYFYKKDFGKSLELAGKTDTEFSPFKYHLKILSLKIYYELEDFDTLYYTIDSFRHFLNKNKLVGANYKVEFNNFLRILDMIVKYSQTNDENLNYKIKKGLENKATAGRRWLKEKFSQLIK